MLDGRVLMLSAVAYRNVQHVMAVPQPQLEVRAGVLYPLRDELSDDERGVPTRSGSARRRRMTLVIAAGLLVLVTVPFAAWEAWWPTNVDARALDAFGPPIAGATRTGPHWVNSRPRPEHSATPGTLGLPRPGRLRGSAAVRGRAVAPPTFASCPGNGRRNGIHGVATGAPAVLR